MFWAINRNTNKKINSLQLEDNSSYLEPEQEIWYADPDEIESCPPNININSIQVNYRKGKIGVINFKGTKYNISPHFYIPNKNKLGINVIPESKEHKLAKNWIYNRIIKQDKNLIVNYSQINKPYRYNNNILLSQLPIDKQLIGIETSCSTFGNKRIRRADIICPFYIKHPLLGKGIVFEIQFSNQRPKTKFDRELDWAVRGYSVCWLYQDDFDKITDIIIDLKNNEVNVSSFSALIKHCNKQHIKNLRYEVQELSRKLDMKKIEINEYLSEQLDSLLQENLDFHIKELVNKNIKESMKDIQPICPKCNIRAKLIDYNNSKFWGCSNYPICKWTSAYAD